MVFALGLNAAKLIGVEYFVELVIAICQLVVQTNPNYYSPG